MSKIKELEDRVSDLAKRRKVAKMNLEDRHRDAFAKQAQYVGNGIYTITGLYSTDTRELMLMFVLQQEGEPVNDKHIQFEDDDQ